MSYRVCIPVAGTGSRLGGLTRYLNKSLVAVANKPILSHIIEAFPEDCEFVLPLGYKGNLVKEFLQMAYPDRLFHFSIVEPYEGPGAGLGLSLSTCEEFLKEPFIFCSCDTLIDEQIPLLNCNWMGLAKVPNVAEYRTARLCDSRVLEVLDKGASGNDMYAYIGLAGIHDYEIFWELMHQGGENAVAMGESFALQRMATSSVVKGYEFTWHDCGNPDALEQTRTKRQKKDDPNILEKANEAIWFVNGKVIKFSDDVQFIKCRVERAAHLAGYVPHVDSHTDHMYQYREVEGNILSEAMDLPVFYSFLSHAESFWLPTKLNSEEHTIFKKRCRQFYKDKTVERIAKFYRDFGLKDDCNVINGIPMPTLENIIDTIDWEWLSNGMPARFHGDFHPENILWNPSDNTFTYLDWRQDFAGDLETGDVYYDLAKLLHGLIISHGIIARDLYTVEWRDGNITFDFHRKQIHVECELAYLQWLDYRQFDRKKVIVLTALIYLNIAPLHHYPYCLLLYAFGKSLLHKALLCPPSLHISRSTSSVSAMPTEIASFVTENMREADRS